MTMCSPFQRFALLLALPAMLVLSACDSHEDDDDDHFGQLERVEVRDRATGFLYATYTRSTDDAFEGGIELGSGQEIALNVLFFDEDGREADLGGDYTLGIRLAEANRDGVEGNPGVVAFEARGDHAYIEARNAGETYLVFQLLHGGHSDGDAPALRLVVGAL